MKLERIKQIIKEEIDNVLNEEGKEEYTFQYFYRRGAEEDEDDTVDVKAENEDKARKKALKKIKDDYPSRVVHNATKDLEKALRLHKKK